MSGYPQFNFPAFDAAAKDLRRDLNIVSPAELDDPHEREAAMQSPDGEFDIGNPEWREYLRRDVNIVMDEMCDGVICLEGWERSVGARLETYVAEAFGKPIYAYYEGEPILRINRASFILEQLEVAF